MLGHDLTVARDTMKSMAMCWRSGKPIYFVKQSCTEVDHQLQNRPAK